MIGSIRRQLASRSPSDRLALAGLAALTGLMLCLWFIVSAQHARDVLTPAVARLRVEAARMDRSADEIARLRAALPAAPRALQTPEDFHALIRAQAGSAGVAGSLTGITSPEAGRAKVTSGGVPFAAWLAWVDSLQAQRIRLDSVRIESAGAPGLVGVTATFVQPTP